MNVRRGSGIVGLPPWNKSMLVGKTDDRAFRKLDTVGAKVVLRTKIVRYLIHTNIINWKQRKLLQRFWICYRCGSALTSEELSSHPNTKLSKWHSGFINLWKYCFITRYLQIFTCWIQMWLNFFISLKVIEESVVYHRYKIIMCYTVKLI